MVVHVAPRLVHGALLVSYAVAVLLEVRAAYALALADVAFGVGAGLVYYGRRGKKLCPM